MNRRFNILVIVFFLLSVSSFLAGANNDILIRNVEWDGEEYRLQHEFNVFKHKFNKVYASPEEELFRFSVFKANMRKAMQLHKKLDDQLAVNGVTQYSNMTEAEFNKFLAAPNSLAKTCHRSCSNPSLSYLSGTGIRPIDLIANLAIESETLSNSFKPLVESSKDSYRLIEDLKLGPGFPARGFHVRTYVVDG